MKSNHNNVFLLLYAWDTVEHQSYEYNVPELQTLNDTYTSHAYADITWPQCTVEDMAYMNNLAFVQTKTWDELNDLGINPICAF